MNAEQEAMNAAVIARVRSFEAAERARDAEGLVAHYASVPEFYFYHDGRRATYDLMAAGVRKAFPAVRSLNVTYSDVEVSALGSGYAIASATFNREIVMEGTGARTAAGCRFMAVAKDGCPVAHRSGSHLAPAGSCEVGREAVQQRDEADER